MTFEVKQMGNETLIKIKGSLDALSSELLKIELIEHNLVDEGDPISITDSAKGKTITIDVSELHFLSASGLSLISIFINPNSSVQCKFEVGNNSSISDMLSFVFSGLNLEGLTLANQMGKQS